MYPIDPTTCYTMPTCGKFRDPQPWATGGMRYGTVVSLSVTFLSESKAMADCLPEPFRPQDEPLVTVTFQECQDVDWLGGRGYNLVGVDAAVVFDGWRDTDVRGSYCIVMWEDMCEPIIGGREHSGVPKVYADIDFMRIGQTEAQCHVSRFSHEFLHLEATQLQPLDDAACRQIEDARRDAIWMNYKYIPKLENDGADVGYVTVYPSSGQCVAAWDGRGSVKFSTATFQQAPTQHEYINLLAALPVLEIRGARLTSWQEVRAIDRRPRRLE